MQFGLWLAIGGTALFALKSIFIKLAYAHGVDTTTLLTLRMLLALPFYAVILGWLLRKPQTLKPVPLELLTLLGLGFMGYYLASWLDMEGLQHISAQLERLTLYTYPIMTTLLGWVFLREKITWRIVLALVLTYSGIVLLYAHEAQWNDGNARLGVMLVTMAALTFACYVVFSKRLIGKLGSLLFTSIAMLASTLFIFVHFLATHALADLAVPLPVWGYAVLLSVFSTVLPSFMISEAIARIGAAKTSIVGTVGPVFTILLAVWLLGEPFGWFHLAGMVLVMYGVSLLRK
ncbi:DMT family transporter [Thiothrix litoralis]|uniref:DMT family transporter n=1 Tax=Thiothrix litoralis TaxID=2891210 RepID=A0ABX7WPM3_9GAMM|nr:DMT family transporter [Thiothrix litoralis]QTR45789.1 DMT family transporter [Thiothrix litoralis]